MYFRSKYAWWLTAIIVAAMAGLAFPAAAAFPSIISYVIMATIIFLGWILRTGYTVHEDKLIIRSGPFKWTVLLADIISIKPSRDPLSSPALSLDRLFIRHKKGFVLISPKEKEKFLPLMKEKCAGAVIDQPVRHR